MPGSLDWLTMRHFDLLILGTGSGNTILHKSYADLSIAIAERWHFGGTCLNVGCIPTKMFVHTADVADAPRDAERFGVHLEQSSADWPAIRDRIFARIDPIESGGREHRGRADNVTVYPLTVSFTGPRSFRTEEGEEFTAERVVLAAGAQPVIPQIPGLAPSVVSTPARETSVHTSDTIMRVSALPESMVILGGGFVAAEMAHIFSSLGTRVTIVLRGERMLTREDDEISRRFTQAAEERWPVFTNARVLDVDADAGGAEIRVAAGGKEHTLRSEVLLLATGRTPATVGLGLETTGFDRHGDGRVAVDAFQRVLSGGEPVPGVFALGDICSPFMLKHVANHEARVVSENVIADVRSGTVGGAGPEELRAASHVAVPSAVFSSPQVASVGLTEAQARAAGRDVTVKVQEYGDVAYGWALEDSLGCLKVVADAGTGELLGAHAVGEQASIIIQPLVTAMSFGLSMKGFARGQYWPHPALSEVVENAVLGLSFPAEAGH